MTGKYNQIMVMVSDVQGKTDDIDFINYLDQVLDCLSDNNGFKAIKLMTCW